MDAEPENVQVDAAPEAEQMQAERDAVSSAEESVDGGEEPPDRVIEMRSKDDDIIIIPADAVNDTDAPEEGQTVEVDDEADKASSQDNADAPVPEEHPVAAANTEGSWNGRNCFMCNGRRRRCVCAG